jgi:hypothetical protein
MAANWFPRLTGTAPTWATRLYVADGIISPSVGTLRIVGQVPAISSASGSGEIDGGGEIGYTVEQEFTAFYDVLAYVERDFVAQYQMTWATQTVVGTLRISGQIPTVAVSDVSWTVQGVGGTLRLVGQVPAVSNSGNVWAYPLVGMVRIAGQTPTSQLDSLAVSPQSAIVQIIGQRPQISPVKLTTVVGTLRIEGNVPTAISPFETYPSTGTLRIVAMGTVSTDFTATWQVNSVAAFQDFTALYGIGGGVSADFSSTWNIESTVQRIAVRTQQRRATATFRSRSATMRTRQRQIRISLSAN